MIIVKPAGNRGPKSFLIRQAQDERATAEVVSAIAAIRSTIRPYQKSLYIRKIPSGLSPHDIGESLLGEQITFEPEIRVSAMQDERVDKGIDHKIEFTVSRAQKMPAVVQVRDNPSILIRMVGMIIAPDVLNHRIDLDGNDLARSKPQGMSEIISRSRADDQHVAKGAAPAMLL